jgi:hypothetical protein
MASICRIIRLHGCEIGKRGRVRNNQHLSDLNLVRVGDGVRQGDSTDGGVEAYGNPAQTVAWLDGVGAQTGWLVVVVYRWAAAWAGGGERNVEHCARLEDLRISQSKVFD